jgi:hypothetical protein
MSNSELSKRLIKLELLKDNAIVRSIELDTSKGSDDFSLSSKGSIFEFPTLEIDSHNPEINSLLMNFGKTETIKLYISNEGEPDFHLVFEGGFLRKRVNLDNKKSQFHIEIGAIHSFYNLGLIKFNQSNKIDGMTFKDFVQWLADQADIKSTLYMSNNIASLVINGAYNQLNAFRLLKEVCYLKDIVVIFKTDNTTHFEFRNEVVNRTRSQIPVVITDKEIISFEQTDGL